MNLVAIIVLAFWQLSQDSSNFLLLQTRKLDTKSARVDC